MVVSESDVNGSPRHVSLDKIKPAFSLREDILNSTFTNLNPSLSNNVNQAISTDVKMTVTNMVPPIRTYARTKKVQFNV